MSKTKLKIFPAMVLVASLGCSLVGCGNDENNSNKSFYSVVLENEADTCLDELLSSTRTMISDQDNMIELSLFDVINELEEKIAIYEELADFSLDEAFRDSEYYTVQEGDTLEEIAEANNISINKLIEWNDLDSEASVEVNQKLRIMEKKVYSLNELEELIEIFNSEDLTSEERIATAKEIGRYKDNTTKWLMDNANAIMEQLSTLTIKCSVLDALSLSEKSYSKVTILSQTEASEDSLYAYDVFVQDYDVDKKGKAISKDVSLTGNLKKIQNYIYYLQANENCEKNEITNGEIKDLKDKLEALKKVVSSCPVIFNGFFHNNLKTFKK